MGKSNLNSHSFSDPLRDVSSAGSAVPLSCTATTSGDGIAGLTDRRSGCPGSRSGRYRSEAVLLTEQAAACSGDRTLIILRSRVEGREFDGDVKLSVDAALKKL